MSIIQRVPWTVQPQYAAAPAQRFHTLLSPVLPNGPATATLGAGWRTITGTQFTQNGTAITHGASATGLVVQQRGSATYFSRANSITSGARTFGLIFTPSALTASAGIWSIGASPNSGTPLVILQQDNGNIRFFDGASYSIVFTGAAVVGVPLYIVVSMSQCAASSSNTTTIGINGVVKSSTGTTGGETTNEYLANGFSTAAQGDYGEFWALSSALNSTQIASCSSSGGFWGWIYAPQKRNRWSPVSAGGGSTAALSNNLATSAAGTPVAGISLALTGNAATSAAGTPVAGISLALTGNGVTASAGSVSPDGSSTAELAGNATTASSGTVAPGITVALTGNEATASVGTLSPAISLALSGLAGTSSAGIVVPGLSLALTGNTATSAAGLVAPGGDVTLALTGNSATASAGALSVGGPLTDAEFRQMYDWLQELQGRQLLTVGTFLALK